MRNTNTFKSNMTKQEFKIYHCVTCKSKFIIYLLECILCGFQYIGKSEWPMNIRINKHRNDVFREEAIHVCQHFRQVSHNFNKHMKMTIIEEVKHQNKSITQKRTILDEREYFWIQRLKTCIRQASTKNSTMKNKGRSQLLLRIYSGLHSLNY